MTSGKDAYARKAGKYFDEGLKERVDVFALMGKVRCEIQIRFKEMLSFSRVLFFVFFHCCIQCNTSNKV